MPGSRDEDLDWLYGRNSQPRRDDPEPTRALPPLTVDGPGSRRDEPETAAHPRFETGDGPRYGDRRSTAAPTPFPAPTPDVRPVRPAPPPGSVPAGPPSRVRRRRHPVRRFFAVLSVLVLACLVWLVGVPLYAWSQVQRIANDPSGARPADQPGYTFLLLGSDSRAGLTKAQRKALGTGNAAGQRTDTIMLLYVPPGGKPALISIPRDSYVSIPGNGKNKINAAYAFGGPKLITQTVEQNTGLRIDGYVEVGFGGFVNVIDALGGIRLCLPAAVKDKDSHIDLKAGCQTLDGANSLGYVRQRHADPLGDLGRVQRQRQMLAAMMKKAVSPASVINPVTYWQLNNAGAASLVLGKTTSAWEMLHFVLAMRTISGGGGYTLTVPVANSNYSTPAGDAVLWDTTKAQQMFGDLARGDTSEMKKFTR